MSDHFRRQCRPALGTLVEIAVHEEDLPAQLNDQLAVFDTAFAQVDTVQRQMSFHNIESELSRINCAAAGTTMEVAPWTYELLTTAMQVFELTGGLFDCGVASHLVQRSLLPDHGFHARHRQTQAAMRSSIASLRLYGGNQITLTDHVCLDLGGIAKGFAVDKAVAAIGAMGISRCLVNAGGDLKVAGDITEDVFVRHPRNPAMRIRMGKLSDGALATSAPYHSLQGEEDRTCCALFDPSGLSLIQNHSYSVLAADCVMADALTKAVAVAFNRQGQVRAPTELQTAQASPFHADFLERCQAQAFVL